MQKKMKIPKMSTRNAGHAVENHFGEERMPLRHKKVKCTCSTRLTVAKYALVVNCRLFFCQRAGLIWNSCTNRDWLNMDFALILRMCFRGKWGNGVLLI